MQYITHYHSPLGDLLVAADEIGLIGIWFADQKYYARSLENGYMEKEIPLFNQVKQWLDLYFSGKNPSFTLPLHMIGTPFQKEVWHLLCTIPYGKTITYGQIAKHIAQKKGLNHMSAQAIGGAVGKNPISIIVPCHRVVGAKETLTGYAGGVKKKEQLLKLEGAKIDA